MRLLVRYILLLCTLFSTVIPMQARVENRSTYPFRASISVQGNSVYLSDYANAISNPLHVYVTCLDPSVSNIQVKLVVGIRVGGFMCKSATYATVPPITMSFGETHRLSDADIANYFRAENLTYSGLQNGRMPEGLAEFSVQVQEYHTGINLSQVSYALQPLRLLSPVRLITPLDKSHFSEQKASNILFSWSSSTPPNITDQVEYEFILKELTDTLSSPQSAFNYASVVYSEVTSLTSLIYSPDKPILQGGKKYAWCVKTTVTPANGATDKPYVENAGYSMVNCFRVEKNISVLQATQITKTQEEPYQNPHCGEAPIIDLSNKTPIESLRMGDTIMAGDFPIVLLEISGSHGTFSGKGSVEIPYLSRALRFAVEFDGIGVNTDKRLISGQIQGIKTGTLDNVANLDAFDYGATRSIEKAVTSADVSLGVALPNAPPPSLAYNASNNKLTFYNATGGIIAETTLNNSQEEKVFPITVQDEEGNLYQIDELQNSDSTTSHTLTVLGKQEGTLPYKSFNTNGIDANIAVVTFKPLHSPYSFDTYKSYYKDIPLIDKLNTPTAELRYPHMGHDYYTPWQFIPLGEKVTLAAQLKINDKKAGIDPKKVIFRTEEGLVVSYTFNEKSSTYTLTIPAAQNEGYYILHALYQTHDNFFYHLGQIGIDTRKPISAKAVLVPMGGTYNKGAITSGINAITKQVGLTWQIEEYTGFECSSELIANLFEKNSGALFSYNDVQKVLNAALKAHLGSGFDASACYVFMFNRAPFKNDRNIIGFMPRGGQYGYVHCNGLGDKELAQILTHELMHGQFLLRHTFDDKYANGLKQGINPDNLMDYKGGTHIAKWQWDQMYDPAITTSLIKYDEEGEIWGTIATYLLKMGVHATINLGTQMVFIYATDDNVENWEQAWKKIDWGEVSFNAFTSIIPGKKEKDLFEIAGNLILCLENSHPQTINDVVQCGFYSLVDYALGSLSDIALNKAVTKLKRFWPELSFKKSDIGEQQHANAPPAKVDRLSQRLANYPKLNKKLTELGELKDKFVEDFDDLTDDQIALFEQNPSLVDSWKRFAQCKTPDELRKNIGAIKALSAPKGSRPNPSTYLSKEYIEAHLRKFENGAAFILTEKDYILHPNIGHANKFVSAPESIERIVRETNGNLRKIEKALGLEKNYLGNNKNEVYIIYIKPDQIKNPRIPDGNENGANNFWIPGGYTASKDAMGIPEIVIDCSHLPIALFESKYNNRKTLNEFFKGIEK